MSLGSVTMDRVIQALILCPPPSGQTGERVMVLPYQRPITFRVDTSQLALKALWEMSSFWLTSCPFFQYALVSPSPRHDAETLVLSAFFFTFSRWILLVIFKSLPLSVNIEALIQWTREDRLLLSSLSWMDKVGTGYQSVFTAERGTVRAFSWLYSLYQWVFLEYRAM